MKILIVDDDPASLAVNRLIVEHCGHEPIAISDSSQALKVIAENKVQVVISDWVMPGLSGLDLVRALRSDTALPYVYFIVLTGTRLGQINFMEAMDAGADDYMEKPARRELLKVRLRVAQRILSQDTEINALKGVIPVCCSCRRVRRDDQAYVSLENYISKNLAVKFSHGLCPECSKKLYPDHQ